MSTEDKAQGGPEVLAGTFEVTPEHVGAANPSPLQATSSKDEVGATSKDVDPGFGGGPERVGAGLTDVGRTQREAADPALQKGEQQKRQP